MPLCRHSLETYLETSSHAPRQGTLGHSHLSSLSHCKLMLAQSMELVCGNWYSPLLKAKKYKESAGGEWIVEPSPESRTARKKPPPPSPSPPPPPLALTVLSAKCVPWWLPRISSVCWGPTPDVPFFKPVIGRNNSLAYSAYCQKFYLSQFCILGPFNFIFPNLLLKWSSVCRKQLMRLSSLNIWFTLFPSGVFAKMRTESYF